MSIVLMKGILEHPKFLNRDKPIFYYINCPDKSIHHHPTINLFFLMRDDWDIHDDN